MVGEKCIQLGPNTFRHPSRPDVVVCLVPNTETMNFYHLYEDWTDDGAHDLAEKLRVIVLGF